MLKIFHNSMTEILLKMVLQHLTHNQSHQNSFVCSLKNHKFL